MSLKENIYVVFNFISCVSEMNINYEPIDLPRYSNRDKLKFVTEYTKWMK